MTEIRKPLRLKITGGESNWDTMIVDMDTGTQYTNILGFSVDFDANQKPYGGPVLVVRIASGWEIEVDGEIKRFILEQDGSQREDDPDSDRAHADLIRRALMALYSGSPQDLVGGK